MDEWQKYQDRSCICRESRPSSLCVRHISLTFSLAVSTRAIQKPLASRPHLPSRRARIEGNDTGSKAGFIRVQDQAAAHHFPGKGAMKHLHEYSASFRQSTLRQQDSEGWQSFEGLAKFRKKNFAKFKSSDTGQICLDCANDLHCAHSP